LVLIYLHNQTDKLPTKLHPESVMVTKWHGSVIKVHTREGSQLQRYVSHFCCLW
jgi:hypothetical protein